MNFLKFLSPTLLLAFLPQILIEVGNEFKKKDLNEVGSDDAFGNVLIALAPAVAAIQNKNENALKKSLRVVRDTLNGYLGENQL